MSTTPHGLPTGVEGKFAHIGGFTDADAATHSDAALTDLANRMMLTLDPNDPKDGADDEENLFVPAGYTYFGQFVDHDLTFDTVSNFNDAGSAARAADQRTPRFDLDNVYGRGPDDQPYMYAEHGSFCWATASTTMCRTWHATPSAERSSAIRGTTRTQSSYSSRRR